MRLARILHEGGAPSDICKLSEEGGQRAGMRATKQGKVAVRLQIGRVVHGLVSRDFYLVQNNSGDAKMPVLYGLNGHQGLVYRADAIIDDDDHR